MMFVGYIEKSKSSKEINDLLDLTWKKLSLDTDFFVRMIDNPHVKKFIAQHSEAIKNKCKNSQNDNLWGVYYKLSNLNCNVEQKPFTPVNIIDKSLRSSHEIDEYLNHKINAALELACFHKVLHDGAPLTEVKSFIDKSKQIIDKFINKEHEEGLYSPILHYLPMDIVETISQFSNKDISSDLWSHVHKFSLITIKDSLVLEEMDELEAPEFIKHKTKEPVVEIIWVLLKNGDFRLSHTYFDINEARGIHHIDLASGEDVVSAGMAIFSKCMKNLLAINNKSGHYTPSLESVYRTVPILKLNGINVENTTLADFCWNNPQPLAESKSFTISNKIKRK